MSKNGRGSEDRRIALVIGSGAVKCAASLGLHALLEREGLGIDLAVGSNAKSALLTVIKPAISLSRASERRSSSWPI